MQWRYNIDLNQVRLPLGQSEPVEVYGVYAKNDTWVQGTVEGPRCMNRKNIGNDAFRQQLGYNVRLSTGHLQKNVPAETVRRYFSVGSDVEYYAGADVGWVPGVAIRDKAEAASIAKVASLQPWRNTKPKRNVVNLNGEAPQTSPFSSEAQASNNESTGSSRDNAPRSRNSWSNAAAKMETLNSRTGNMIANNAESRGQSEDSSMLALSGDANASRPALWMMVNIKIEDSVINASVQAKTVSSLPEEEWKPAVSTVPEEDVENGSAGVQPAEGKREVEIPSYLVRSRCQRKRCWL
jgi:hypothetical protein